MAYADQQMSGNRVIAIILVALIHIAVIYAMVTGLAYEAYKKAIEHVTTVNVNTPPPPPKTPPPPPPPNAPPPPVAPPPPININVAPPPIQVQPNIPPPAPIQLQVPPPAPPPPKAPQRPNPIPRGNPSDWANTDDYPARALRENEQGTARFSVTVGPDGRVQDCQIVASSGHPDLDQTTCQLITRRARFEPKLDADGNPTTGTYSNSVRWQIPQD